MKNLLLAGIAAIGFASCGNATGIGEQSFHGSELRRMCLGSQGLSHYGMKDLGDSINDMEKMICYHRLDQLINENVEKTKSKPDSPFALPDDAQLEDLEANVINYMKVYRAYYDDQDAHLIVGVVMACRYPSDKTKNLLSSDPKLVKECQTIYGPEGSPK